MELLDDVGHVESPLGPFGDSVTFGALCMVCAIRTIGSEIVLDAPDGTLGDEDQMEAHFGPFGDSVSFSAR
jgi:hypothetical protein